MREVSVSQARRFQSIFSPVRIESKLAHNPDFGTIQNLIIGFTLRMILHVLLHAQRIDIKWLIVFIHPTSFFHLPSNTRLQDFIAESSVRHYHTVQIRQWWARFCKTRHSNFKSGLE